MNSELADRLLWYDGKSSMDVCHIAHMILNGDDITDIYCLEYDAEVPAYNKLANCDLQVKYTNDEIHTDWNIPDKYKEIDIETLIRCKAIAHHIGKGAEYVKKSDARITYELGLIADMKLSGLFQCILYLLDVFIEQKIVWGVGRGSSCASYILYLMDLHCVDPIKYDIPANEFYKEVINKVHNEGE